MNMKNLPRSGDSLNATPHGRKYNGRDFLGRDLDLDKSLKIMEYKSGFIREMFPKKC